VAWFANLEPIRGEDPPNADISLLNRYIKDSSDAGILSYLTTATWPEINVSWVNQQIALLASPDYRTREKAASVLCQPSLNLLAYLRKAQSDVSPEVRRRLSICIANLEHAMSYEQALVFRAAVRETIRRRPKGMEESLLRALPMLANDELASDVQFALEEAVQNRKSVDPLFEHYLSDSAPIRRSIAGLLLARYGNAEQKLKSKKLLTDDSPAVRLRTAQGFLATGDKSVIPVLISLLACKPVFVAWQAEELLAFIAGKEASLPIPVIGDGQSAPMAHEGWQDWWAQYGEKFDLPAALKVGHAPAFFLVQALEPEETYAFVVGGNGKIRWTTWKWKPSDQGSMCKLDQILDDDRVLIWSDRTLAEFRANPNGSAELSLRERSLDGTTKSVICRWLHEGWRGTIPQVYARQMMMGHSICVNIDKLVQLQTPAERVTADRTDNPLVNTGGPNFKLTDLGIDDRRVHFERFAAKPRALLLNSGNILEVEGGEDFKGESIHRERDMTGRQLWEIKGEYQYIVRLRDGHYLATGYRGNGIFELDARAQVVWKLSVRTKFGEIRLAAPLLRLGFETY
jgi:hypothetical protein